MLKCLIICLHGLRSFLKTHAEDWGVEEDLADAYDINSLFKSFNLQLILINMAENRKRVKCTCLIRHHTLKKYGEVEV